MYIDPKIMTLYYWLFKKRHNVKFIEMCRYLATPNPAKVASRFISGMVQIGPFMEISFNTLADKLYWPVQYKIDHLYQICSEIFDLNNWHYYEDKNMKVGENDVVIDVGASEGLFSLSVINRCGRILIIEPNEVFFRALEKTFIKYIPVKAELLKVAVGDKNSSVSITSDSIMSAIDGKIGNTAMVTLDELLRDKAKIDYIKADIEGYEMKMLHGAVKTISKHKPRILITTYHENNDYTEIIKFVKNLAPEYKYRVKGITQYSGKPVMLHFWI